MLLFALVLSTCGQSGESQNGGQTPPPPPGPFGNWALAGTDASNNRVTLNAFFSQTGGAVIAHNVTAVGSRGSFACVPFSGFFSNGTIINGSNLIGSFTFTNSSTGTIFGALQINVILAADGKSFSGTYAGMPSCSGIAAGGTLTGTQVPSMTGSWTGTLQPCTYSQQTGVCTLTGTAGSITASLTQNDLAATVSGSYQVSNVSGFSSGTITVVPPFDLLSGQSLQLTMTDANGTKFTAAGGPCCGANTTGLGFDRSVMVNVFNFANSATAAWLLSMTH
jgi:hypothetical protein